MSSRPISEAVNVVLEVRDLKVSYGQIKALKGVSMRVDRGEFVGTQMIKQSAA